MAFQWKEAYAQRLWGAAFGAAALAIVGFSFGGWKTTSSAQAGSDAAIWTALIPVCADVIQANPAAAEDLAKAKPGSFDDVVRKHLKSVATRSDHGYKFRRECGEELQKRQSTSAAK